MIDGAGATLLPGLIEWRRATVSFAELGLDGTDLQAIFFGGGPALGAFRLRLDDVRLLPR